MARQEIQVRMADDAGRQFVSHLLQEHGFRVTEEIAYRVAPSGRE